MKQVLRTVLSVGAVGFTLVGSGQAFSRGRAPVAHTAPCRYPHGWNAADYSDDLAGRPKDRYHQCLVGKDGQLLDSDGQPTD